MKINYTSFLRDKPHETDPEKISAMKDAVSQALLERDISPDGASCEYYADGRVKVKVNGEYYNIFDTNTGKFFSGYVGDRPGRA